MNKKINKLYEIKEKTFHPLHGAAPYKPGVNPTSIVKVDGPQSNNFVIPNYLGGF